MYSLEDKKYLDLYFSIKDRDYSKKIDRTELNNITQEIYESLDSTFFNSFDIIVIPESSSEFILNIVKKLNINYYILEKNSKEFIYSNLSSMNFSRQELESQKLRINKMNDSFKLNKIKSNQRSKYIDILFKEPSIDLDGKILFLDDSSFTGNTFKAAQSKVDFTDTYYIFH